MSHPDPDTEEIDVEQLLDIGCDRARQLYHSREELNGGGVIALRHHRNHTSQHQENCPFYCEEAEPEPETS